MARKYEDSKNVKLPLSKKTMAKMLSVTMAMTPVVAVLPMTAEAANTTPASAALTVDNGSVTLGSDTTVTPSVVVKNSDDETLNGAEAAGTYAVTAPQGAVEGTDYTFDTTTGVLVIKAASVVAGQYTITYTNTAEPTVTASATVTAAEADTVKPTVLTPSTISSVAVGGTFSIVFSEQLSENAKGVVEEAIKGNVGGVAGTDLEFSWNGATLTVTNNGSAAATFASDVTADIEDIAGNQTVMAKIIDIKEYLIETPTVEIDGLSATVTATIRELGNLPEQVTTIFQLMDGNTPIQLIAVKNDIQNNQEVSAKFNLPSAKNYTVKVLLWDSLTGMIVKADDKTAEINAASVN